jgi:hypothetical protein
MVRPGRKRTGAPTVWCGRVQISALVSPEARDALLLTADANEATVASIVREGIALRLDADHNNGEEANPNQPHVPVNPDYEEVPQE